MTESPRPTITVQTAVHHEGAWVASAIESIRQQSFHDWELLLVLDRPDPIAKEICTAAADADPRVRIVLCEGKGVAAAQNTAIRHGRGPLIAVLDADDVAHPRRLSIHETVLRDNPDAMACTGWAINFDATGPRGALAPPTHCSTNRWEFGFANPLIHSAALVRREALMGAGPYDRRLDAAPDYDVFERMISRGCIIGVPAVVLLRRVHSESVTARRSAQQHFTARFVRKRWAERLEMDPHAATRLVDGLDAAVARGEVKQFLDAEHAAWASFVDRHRPDATSLREMRMRRLERFIWALQKKGESSAIVAHARGVGLDGASWPRLLASLRRRHRLRRDALASWPTPFPWTDVRP